MPETRGPRPGSGSHPAATTAQPIKLKNGIAVLNPEPIARGAFGQVYIGKMGNPVALLAERVVFGEEDPKWLGLDDVPYEEPAAAAQSLPRPIADRAARMKVYDAATRLWNEYLARYRQDPAKAADEYRDLLGLIDPLLLQDRTIAVKVLVPPSDPDPELDKRVAEDSLRRFIKENDILRRLEHPGIVRRFGLVEDPSMGWCLLLEYIAGETLDEHLYKYDERRMPIPVVLQRLKDIAEAIQYIHGKGVIHRDLKPSNIMIREDDGRAVIMDFGIGKWSNESHTQQLTIPGARVGTPRYMAPEQVAGEAGITTATDIYQLCTILFEMVTGRAAYEGMDNTAIFTWLADGALRHPLYVADYLPGISRELEALIEVGRDKRPEHRWTIDEFLEKLGAIIASGKFIESGPHRPLGPTELRQALLKTRMRKKEAVWEEHQLETRLHYVSLHDRIHAARRLIAQGQQAEARMALRLLAGEVQTLPPRYDSLKIEVEALAREVESSTAQREAEQLLAKAEEDYAAQRFPEVGARLEAAAQRLNTLPAEAHPELHARYKRLHDLYEGHRSYVDLFNTLRKSFVVKIREKYDELQQAYAARQPVDAARVRELLEQVTIADNNLRLIEREKIGMIAYDRTRRDLEEQKVALEDFLKRISGA